MRFWTLTALTMVFAMAAGTAQAQGNSNGLAVTRTIHLESPVWDGPSDIQGSTEGGEPKGKLSVRLQNDQPQAEFGEGATFQLDLRSFSCPGTINWSENPDFFEDLDLQSRIVWVLYLTVGDQLRRIITFRPDCSSFGTTWADTQINGFLIDNQENDDTLWNERVMTDSLTVEVFFEVIGNPELNELYFEGFSPAVQ